MPDGIDWRDRMRVAFQVFNLSPSVFWGMTEHEWAAKCEAWNMQHINNGKAKPVMTKDRLAELMAKFPDKKGG